jgi:acyl carrier protein
MSIPIQLAAIFQDVFDNPDLELTAEMGPDQIEDWDSVAQVKLVLSIEEAFGLRFTSDEITSIHTVGDFLTVIEQKKGQK